MFYSDILITDQKTTWPKLTPFLKSQERISRAIDTLRNACNVIAPNVDGSKELDIYLFDFNWRLKDWRTALNKC